MMRRLNFGVVTLTVTLFVAMAFLLAILKPHIPPQAPNDLAREEGDYMAMGVHQGVKWKPFDAGAFAESRRTGKPLMLAIGAAWSTDAMKADRVFFSDPEIQSYLGRNFICVRIDLDRRPAYSLVLAPIGRIENPAASNPFTVGFQLAFVRPDGEPYRFLAVSSIPEDTVEFLNHLVRAHDEFISKPPETTLQDQDRNLLLNERGMPPAAPSQYIDRLMGFIDAERGGFGNSPPTGRMCAWQALLVNGQGDAFDVAVAPFVRSGLVDWLDGGFFSRADDTGLRRVQFGKPSIFNAEMMHVLALGGHVRGNPFYTRLAKNAFDWLTGKAMREEYIATARISQANQYGRDERSSIAVKDLREFWGSDLLTPEEVVWARENMGLRVEENASMVVRVQDSAVLEDPMFGKVISKFRKYKQSVPLKFTTLPRADVNGNTLARLTACARLWNDKERLAVCRRLFGRLDRFRAGTDIAHIVPFDLDQERYLGDYLGYADAALSLYLATGESSYFYRGQSVLLRANQMFGTPSPGIWTPMPYPVKSPLQGIDVPEVIDNMGESLTARMMRLAVSYHRINPTAELKVMSDASYAALNRFSGLLPQTGLLGGGLYCSTAFLIDDESALVVGPNAAQEAADLFRASPTRLIAPALPEFKSSGDGVYVYSAGLPNGPMSSDEAKALLPASLNPG